MPRRKHTPEEIAAKPLQVDVLVSRGTPVADAVRQIVNGGAKLDHVAAQ